MDKLTAIFFSILTIINVATLLGNSFYSSEIQDAVTKYDKLLDRELAQLVEQNKELRELIDLYSKLTDK